MASKKSPVLRLSRLHKGIHPGVTSSKGACFADAASVCLNTHTHANPVSITLDRVKKKRYSLEWNLPTSTMKASHNDLQDATEEGAYAIAFLTVLDVTPYTVIRKSRKGTGFDWFLGKKRKPLFQEAARLEVSGILKGTLAQISGRMSQKTAQTSPSDGTRLPAYISITEFGTPCTRLIKK